MTPDEKKWLAEYNRREAKERIKALYKALGFWGAFAVIWLFFVFSEPDDKFTITDSLFLIMIIVNGADTVSKLIRNRRIAAGYVTEKRENDDNPNNN